MPTPARRTVSTNPTLTEAAIGCAKLIGIAFLLVWALVTWIEVSFAAAAFPLFILAGWAVADRTVRIRRAREQRQLRAVQSTEIARYHTMSARQFEEAVAFLCERDGCRDVRVAGGAGDLGADVTATAPDGRRIVIQCKRYGPTTKVGSPDLQRFGGTCYSVHGAQVAAVVTTSVFTKPAADYARQHRITPYDETALAAWATHTGPAPWT